MQNERQAVCMYTSALVHACVFKMQCREMNDKSSECNVVKMWMRKKKIYHDNYMYVCMSECVLHNSSNSLSIKTSCSIDFSLCFPLLPLSSPTLRDFVSLYIFLLYFLFFVVVIHNNFKWEKNSSIILYFFANWNYANISSLCTQRHILQLYLSISLALSFYSHEKLNTHILFPPTI